MSNTIITGKVFELGKREEYTNKQTGEVKQKLTFIIDKNTQYDSHVAVTILGEKVIDKAAQTFDIGDIINCEVVVSSTKWNDRWFNNVKYVSATKNQ